MGHTNNKIIFSFFQDLEIHKMKISSFGYSSLLDSFLKDFRKNRFHVIQVISPDTFVLKLDK